MEITGTHFEYAGTPSRTYNLILANVDTSRYTSIIGDVKPVTVFNKRDNRNYFIGEEFDNSPIQFDADIVAEDGVRIPVHLRRKIEKWLFHQPDYQRLYFDIEDDPFGETFDLINGELKRLYLNCRFTSPEKIEYFDGVVGYKVTVECDSCMAWQEPIAVSYDIEKTPNPVIDVEVDTDLNDYIYPKVTITMGSVGGDITISNNTDSSSRLTSFVGLTAGITFTMNGNGVNYISGDNYLKFSNKNFVRLLDGNNKISIIGDVAKISFEWSNRRYL